MPLTPNQKEAIDRLTYEELLGRCRFAPIGDPFWQGEKGDYAMQRMHELKKVHPDPVRVSKQLGWD
jgi:hypothetical protein